MSSVLVLAEHRDSEIDAVTLQLLHKGRQLADQLGVGLGVLVVGSDISVLASAIADKGVDTVYTVESPEINLFNPEVMTQVIANAVRTINPGLLFLGYTFLGMEIGPAIATRLGIPMVSNGTDIELSPEGLAVVAHPVFSGTRHVRMKGPLPLLVSVPRGVLSGKTLSPRQSQVVPVDIELDRNSLRTEVVDILRPGVGEVDFTKADVIVAVGRGIGQAANVELARNLATALGGVIAATRPVIDMGWLLPEYQIGLSGKTVSPRVYIACGISGAAQHVAGMIDSQMIIAINKDPNAPIFSVAHYAIVGDLFEIVPTLIDAAGEQTSFIK